MTTNDYAVVHTSWESLQSTPGHNQDLRYCTKMRVTIIKASMFENRAINLSGHRRPPILTAAILAKGHHITKKLSCIVKTLLLVDFANIITLTQNTVHTSVTTTKHAPCHTRMTGSCHMTICGHMWHGLPHSLTHTHTWTFSQHYHVCNKWALHLFPIDTLYGASFDTNGHSSPGTTGTRPTKQPSKL